MQRGSRTTSDQQNRARRRQHSSSSTVAAAAAAAAVAAAAAASFRDLKGCRDVSRSPSTAAVSILRFLCESSCFLVALVAPGELRATAQSMWTNHKDCWSASELGAEFYAKFSVRSSFRGKGELGWNFRSVYVFEHHSLRNKKKTEKKRKREKRENNKIKKTKQYIP